MYLADFLTHAGGRGPCVGLRTQTTPEPVLQVPAGFEVRGIDAAEIATLDQLYDAFADAWNFPDSFASLRNADAFNDWMRDFDNHTNLRRDKPDAAGYLTHVTDAHRLLPEQPDVFAWFAGNMSFYRDYYRDDLDPPAAFALLLAAPGEHLEAVRTRWRSAGGDPAPITI